MLIFKQIISHPYFWMGIFLLISIFFYLKGKKTRMIISICLSVFFATLCTPIISYWGLESLKYFSPISDEQCTNSTVKDVILLPGGTHISDGDIKLNTWSMQRANLIFKLSENKALSRVIIPGGYLGEGGLLKTYLNRKLDLSIHVGMGSSNTAGNFEEISDFLVKGRQYWLVTSYWHYIRSYLVASKLGVNVCPVLTQGIEPSYWLYHRDAHWNGKAFMHEYIAIVYYWLLGKI